MSYTATITSKRQLTIPAELFKLGKFVKGQKVKMEWSEESLKVFCNNKSKEFLSEDVDIVDLAGTLKPKKNIGVDPLKAREYMEKHYKRV